MERNGSTGAGQRLTRHHSNPETEHCRHCGLELPTNLCEVLEPFFALEGAFSAIENIVKVH